MNTAESHAEAAPTLREATADDVPFILNSWLRSYEPTATAAGVPRGRFYAEHHTKVTRLLQRGRCLLAVNPAEPSVILGYAAYEERGGQVVLHYLYVKHQLRRMGLGRHLAEQVRARGCRYTHHTRAGARLVELLGARYSPEFIESP